MDRKSWIAIILSVTGLFAWQWYVSKYYAPQTPPVAAPASPDATASAAAAAAPAPSATPSPVADQPPVMSARAESLSTNSTEFVFNNDAGGLEPVIHRMHLGET
ncbi:MAG: hypothetical protein ACKOEZ_02010, partial [Spartobacteria bacterium]